MAADRSTDVMMMMMTRPTLMCAQRPTDASIMTIFGIYSVWCPYKRGILRRLKKYKKTIKLVISLKNLPLY